MKKTAHIATGNRMGYLDFDDIFRFLESYSEYHIGDIVIDNDGEETDAQMIARLLPELKKSIRELEKTNNDLEKQISEYEDIIQDYCDETSELKDVLKNASIIDGKVVMTQEEFEQKIKNAYDSGHKCGRESVDPHFRYCICDYELHTLGLTDDIGKAIEEAAKRSRSKMWNIYKIAKADDGWRTYNEGFCEGGHYYDGNRRFFCISTSSHKRRGKYSSFN